MKRPKHWSMLPHIVIDQLDAEFVGDDKQAFYEEMSDEDFIALVKRANAWQTKILVSLHKFMNENGITK